jgi:branched-chain amino acid transport system permease protein
VLLAVLLGGLMAAVFGALIGLLTIRLGDLYVAIVTLTFGSLVEGLVFTRDRFVQGGLGVTVNRPGFAQTDFAFAYLGLAVFAVIALLIINLRRSTSGMALRAVRDSETASRMLGLSVIQVKVIIGAIGAFIAAIGGGFLAMYAENAQPTSFDIFLGMIWLAVAVTWGVRSITGAALAGITLSIMPGVFATYVPVKWAVVPSVLFGLGAVSVARNPEGVIAQYARQLSDLIPGVRKRDAPPPPIDAASPLAEAGARQ